MKPEFIKSIFCVKRKSCVACRTSQEWRDRMTPHYKMPVDFNTKCPFGVIHKKKKIDSKIIGHDKIPKITMVKKVVDFTKIVLSGRCSDLEYTKRKQACASCSKLKIVEQKWYCGACGCPKWKLAELGTKLRFKNLPCPLGKSGFYEEPK